ncbi:hypothetical protein Bpfe_003788 [Biomphalaria pfeifferi]|uniref:Uncharacterized protein n=1 Tax=Biomphalaria pfeifferi TaxID=112525 RepID=A0AAD8FKA2_BIOPF|nr:hypothetical protein Bpfe_003788 [Biomphalaria pfeifferi]
MYPNTTGNVSDRNYGENTTFHIPGSGLVNILTGSSVGLLILITIAVIVIILIIKKTKVTYYSVNNTKPWAPQTESSIDDSYSNFDKLQTGIKVSPSEDLNATVLKSNQPMKFDVGNANCTMYTVKEPDIYSNGDIKTGESCSSSF